MYGQGHYFCRHCNHLVYARRGGCGTCNRSLAQLMLFDAAWNDGYVNQMMFNSGGIGWDPFDGEPVFEIPGTDIGIEPDGTIDIDGPFGLDVPIGDVFDDGGW